MDDIKNSFIKYELLEFGAVVPCATHIVLGIDERFIRGASVCIASAAYNSTNGICAHIIYGQKEVSKGVVDILSRLVNTFSKLSIRLYSIEDFASHLSVTESITSAMYYRYSIGELLWKITDRVIYLDADVVVDCAIDDLYSVDMKENMLAAVEDYVLDADMPNEVRMREYYHGLYFNSGVLLVDTNAWKKKNILELAVNKTCELSGRLKHYDQDVLNILFANNWLELDRKWNYISYKDDPTSDVIAHYIGSKKPWVKWYKNNGVDLYDQYEKMTPYKNLEKQDPCFENVKEAKYYKRCLWEDGEYLKALKWEFVYSIWKLRGGKNKKKI